MEIGFGSVSDYDSIRYPLYLDNTNKAFFTDAPGKKYSVQLDDKYLQIINQNKKIWIILSNKSHREIKENNITRFENPTIHLL